MTKECNCVGGSCLITEVIIDDLRDFWTFERDFHKGPIWTKHVSKAGESELHRQARRMSGFFEDCPGECVCQFPDEPPGPWDEKVVDIFGFGSNGLVFLCTATKRTRKYPASKCGPPPPFMHVVPHRESN